MIESKVQTVEPSQTTDALQLRDPLISAILAWLIPGLGHWYQGRRAKAVIFFVCVLSSFYYGLYLGSGRVVYAAWNQSDRRLPYLCQAFVGLPSLPAFVQARRFGFYNVNDYMFRQRVIIAAQTRLNPGVTEAHVRTEQDLVGVIERLAENKGPVSNWFMVPPVVKAAEAGDTPDELDLLHKKLNRYFELGTVYTMIAGLLNILVIYDAWGGPAFGLRSPKYSRPPPTETAIAATASPRESAISGAAVVK